MTINKTESRMGSFYSADYHISMVVRQSFSFQNNNQNLDPFFPKQSSKSRSILQNGSRSLVLFKKDKIGIIAKFHRTDLVIFSRSREGKTPSDSQINTVHC